MTQALESGNISEYQYLDKNIAMSRLFRQTAADVWIVFCQFHDRDCKDEWAKEETLYGFCLRFRTTLSESDRPAVDRRSALTVYLGFNRSDGYHGNVKYLIFNILMYV